MEQEYESAHGLKEYFRILLKRVWLLIIVFVVSVTAVAIASFRMEPIYRATALLRIEKKTPNIVPIQDVYQIDVRPDEYYETQYKLIKSRNVCKKVFARLELGKLVRYEGAQDPEGAFIEELIVDPVPDTYLANVSYESEDPKLAARVANGVADEYIASVKRDKRMVSDEAESGIAQQLPILREKRDKSEEALREFEKESSALSFEKRRAMIYEAFSSLNAQLIKVKQEIAKVEARYESVAKAKTVQDMLSLPAVVNNTAIQGYNREKLVLEARAAELSQKYKADSEPIKAIKSKTKVVDEKIRSEASKIARSIETELQEKKSEEEKLQALIEKQKKLANTFDANMNEYESLKAGVERNRRHYEKFLQSQKELQSSSRFNLSTVQIVDRAEVPEIPVRPRKMLNLLVAAVLSLLGGVGLAFLFEHLDDSIKSHEEIERYVKLPMLGMVPSVKADRKNPEETDLFAHRKPKSSISEAYRTIRTSLLYASANKEPKAYVVTSAGPQEGKTTTAVNLSIALAHAGKKVLLVDSDLRKPRIHKTFKVDNAKGLTNYLVGQDDTEELALQTEIENLSFIPSGPIPPNPTELLDSVRMQEFIAKTKKDFDSIIFDSPPLVAVADAAVLAAMSDGAIQVIWAGNTSRKIVELGKERIKSVGSKIIGVILNNIRAARGEDYYYYSRYYKYYRTEDKGESGG